MNKSNVPLKGIKNNIVAQLQISSYDTNGSLFGIRPVVSLTSETVVSGSGTSNNPFIVVE